MSKPLIIFSQNERSGGNTINNIIFQSSNKRGKKEAVIKLGVVDDKSYSYFDILQNINKPTLEFVLGHNVYGLHRHSQRQCEYVYMLRHPLKRIISIYTGWEVTTGTHIKNWVPHCVENNGMVLRACGFGILEGKPYNFLTDEYIGTLPVVTPELLKMAIENIENFGGHVTIQELYEESQIVLEESFDLFPLVSLIANRYNQSSFSLYPDELEQETIDIILEHNSFDIQLYDHFYKIMKSRIETEKHEFKEKVRIRKILAHTLNVPSVNELTTSQVTERIMSLFNKLLFIGMFKEVNEIIKLLFKMNLPPEFVNAITRSTVEKLPDEYKQ